MFPKPEIGGTQFENYAKGLIFLSSFPWRGDSMGGERACVRTLNKDAGGCIYISKIGINDRRLNGKYIPINRCYIQAYGQAVN
jgi:hypothetical protein